MWKSHSKASFTTWTAEERKQTKEMGWRKRKKIGCVLVSKPMMVGTSQVIFKKIFYSFTRLLQKMAQIVSSACMIKM